MTEIDLNEIRKKLVGVANAATNAEEKSNLTKNLAEFQKTHQHLSSLKKKLEVREKLEKTAEIAVPRTPGGYDLSEFQIYLSEIQTNFGESSTSQTLRKGDKYVKLFSDGPGSLFKTVQEVMATLETDWATLVTSYFPPLPGRPPDPRNKALETQYEEKMKSKGLFVQFPEDAAVINELKKIKEELNKIAGSIKTDAPEEVKIFFGAMNNGQASLDLFTTEVSAWLKEQNLNHLYEIKSRGPS